jgi:hypothetical protein
MPAMDRYFPFNSINRDRVYQASNIADFMAVLLTNGVTPMPSTSLKVSVNNGWVVNVGAGKCVINGYTGEQDASTTLTLSAPSGSNPRIDTIVARLNQSARVLELDVLQGVSSANPAASALTRDSTKWELALAQVLINPADTMLKAAQITDTRGNTNLCGYVNSLITADTTDLFSQFQAAWDDFFNGAQSDTAGWMAEQKGAFEAWFSSIEDMLDDNQAAQLAGQIANLNTIVTDLQNNTVLRPDVFISGNYASFDPVSNRLVDTGFGAYSPPRLLFTAPIAQARIVIWDGIPCVEYWVDTSCSMTVSGIVIANCAIWLCGGGGAGKPSSNTNASNGNSGGGGGGGYPVLARQLALINTEIIIGEGGLPAANGALGGEGGISQITYKMLDGTTATLSAQGGRSVDDISLIVNGGDGGSGGGFGGKRAGSVYSKGATGTGAGSSTIPFNDSTNFNQIPCAGGGGGACFANAAAYPSAGGSNGSDGVAAQTANTDGAAGGVTGGGKGGAIAAATAPGADASYYGGGGGGGGRVSGTTASSYRGGIGYKGLVVIRVPMYAY